MKLTAILCSIGSVLLLVLAACANAPAAPQPPKEYLDGALNWMQTHAVTSKNVDWSAVRRDAQALVPNPKTTSETYPAIRLALGRLGDGNAFFLMPEASSYDPGLNASYPENIVLFVTPDGPAEKAGVRVGDQIEKINGAPPQPFNGNPSSFFIDFGPNAKLDLTLRRAGQTEPLQISFQQAQAKFDTEGKPITRRLENNGRGIGYIELTTDGGANASAGHYTGQVQKFMRKVDNASACGWIVDLRRNTGGDLWTYLAALGPLLGQGNVGGFAYADGKRDAWTYENGIIKWAGNERAESAVEDGVVALKQPNAPVALLVRRSTIAAGELVAVAFQGRGNVRVIGEPTGGIATLTEHTPLSDDANLFVSGAYGMDRSGKIYDKPIQPDEIIKTDWNTFGTDDDAVIAAARAWLENQSGCQ